MHSMKHVQEELSKQGWEAKVTYDEDNARAYLEVSRQDRVDFLDDIRLCEYLMPDFAYPELPPDESNSPHYYRAEVFLRRGGSPMIFTATTAARLLTTFSASLKDICTSSM